MEIKQEFSPAWWLPGPHTQTIWSYLFRKNPDIQLIPERLELPDGDFVDLCWTTNKTGPIVAIFHGLEGSIDSPYARPMLTALHKQGWRGVFMHFRGCSTEHNRLDRNYHSGDTCDITFLLDTLRQRYPGIPLAAIGYSLGGNALLKYLGENDRKDTLSAAAVISVPFLLKDCATRLEHGLSRIYQAYLIRKLVNKVRSKFSNRTCPIQLNNLTKLSTFHQFDDHVTAPLHGFADVHDYYARSSSRQFLGNINVPTLIIHALDDPFMTGEVIPNDSELSDMITFELYKNGGHVGFVSGAAPWRCEYWLEKRVPDFLRSYIK